MAKSVTNGLQIGIDGRELLPDRITGIGRYLRNFLDVAVPARPQHRFIVYGNQHTRYDRTAPNLTLRLLPERCTLWWDQVTLARCARQDRVDVFFSPYDKGPVLAPCPVVLTVHDLTFLVISERGAAGKLFYNATYMALRAPVIRRASRIITDSGYSRNDIATRLRVPTTRITVIPIGVSASYRPIHDRSQIEAFSTHYGLTRPYILYVGNFKPHKNVTMLLKAYAALPEALRAAYRLVLCGRRDRFREHIQMEAKALGVAPRFLDFVLEEDMPLLYGAAAVFAFPSLYEGFGLPPLEAMACGTPVVSSSATSLPEVIGDAGILVDPTRVCAFSDALARVLSDTNLKQQLSRRSLTQAAKFTPERTAERVLRVIEDAACRTRQVP